MITVTLDSDVVVDEQLLTLLQKAVVATVRHETDLKSATVALLISDDARLQSLNKMFRGIDKATDVLSFEDGEPPHPGAAPHLGDIAISLERAVQQAATAGHQLEAELQLLGVHGTLHLLGYDHADETQKTEMWRAQSAVLHLLGVEYTQPL